MKRVAIIMASFALLSITTVYVLSGMADRSYAGYGFTRAFRTQSILRPIDTLDLKYDSYYLAGGTDYYLYLGNIAAPRHLLAVNRATLDTQHIVLEMNNPERLEFYQVRVKVDSPFFYLMDGAVPALFKGTLQELRASPIDKNKIPYFIDIASITPGSFVVRSLDSKKEARLGTFTIDPPKLNFDKNPLEKQVDGIFCTDGTLHHDKEKNRIVYLYLYRNEYLVMDNDLDVLHKGHTIDTTTTAKIEIATISSSNTRTFSNPPSVINRTSSISEEHLYVNSLLHADNEPDPDFDENAVIDVYEFARGRYVSSFYIPEYRNARLRHFDVAGAKVYALYERHLVSYSLDMDSPITRP